MKKSKAMIRNLYYAFLLIFPLLCSFVFFSTADGDSTANKFFVALLDLSIGTITVIINLMIEEHEEEHKEEKQKEDI